MELSRRNLLSTGFAAIATGTITVVAKNAAEEVIYDEPKPLNQKDAGYFALGAVLGGAASIVSRMP